MAIAKCWCRTVNKTEIIDQALLQQVAEAGAASPRRRKNYNFHATDADASHRLLNAIDKPEWCHKRPLHEGVREELGHARSPVPCLWAWALGKL